MLYGIFSDAVLPATRCRSAIDVAGNQAFGCLSSLVTRWQACLAGLPSCLPRGLPRIQQTLSNRDLWSFLLGSFLHSTAVSFSLSMTAVGAEDRWQRWSRPNLGTGRPRLPRQRCGPRSCGAVAQRHIAAKVGSVGTC